MPKVTSSSTNPPNKTIEIYYEEQGTGDPLLLIMGLGSQHIAWPQLFVGDLVKRGFQVIRFDNRDCGLSTHLGVPPCSLIPFVPAPYLLKDMADDAESLLSQRVGNAKVHVVGASMGGMIAQLLTLNHPSRVRSLCSIMSTTGNPNVGGADDGIYEEIGKPVVPPERDKVIARTADILALIGSKTHPLTRDEALHQATEAYDRAASNPSNDGLGTKRQICAILAASNREGGLDDVTVPTFVIHGLQDPLIHPSGGLATAKAIPGAELRGFADMGHDLPKHLWTDIADYIEENAKKAGA